MSGDLLLTATGVALSLVLAFFVGAAWLVNRMDRLHEQTRKDRHNLAEKMHMIVHNEVQELKGDMNAMETRLNERFKRGNDD